MNELEIWTIYKRPKDFPAHYVARCHLLTGPTERIILGSTLEDVREALPEGLHLMPRSEQDDECIVETWI